MGVGGFATFLGKTVVGRVGRDKVDNNFLLLKFVFF